MFNYGLEEECDISHSFKNINISFSFLQVTIEIIFDKA
jgi:hypothetical protein